MRIAFIALGKWMIGRRRKCWWQKWRWTWACACGECGLASMTMASEHENNCDEDGPLWRIIRMAVDDTWSSLPRWHCSSPPAPPTNTHNSLALCAWAPGRHRNWEFAPISLSRLVLLLISFIWNHCDSLSCFLFLSFYLCVCEGWGHTRPVWQRRGELRRKSARQFKQAKSQTINCNFQSVCFQYDVHGVSRG